MKSSKCFRALSKFTNAFWIDGNETLALWLDHRSVGILKSIIMRLCIALWTVSHRLRCSNQ